MKNLRIELLGRVVLVVAWWFSSGLGWWVPLLLAPLVWQVWEAFSGSVQERSSLPPDGAVRLLADVVSHGAYFGYIAYAAVVFWRHVGAWKGLAVGIVLSILVVQVLGLLWPRRWHLEAINGRL